MFWTFQVCSMESQSPVIIPQLVVTQLEVTLGVVYFSLGWLNSLLGPHVALSRVPSGLQVVWP